MFSSHVPQSFWGESILTAFYLINRLPSKPLKFQTPISVLQKTFPESRVINSLSPKVFGCSAFVHNISPNKGKLDPKSTKCVFVGYSSTQKGYKCFNPHTKRFSTSYDVTFLENQPFYSYDSLQGETSNEENHWDPSISLPMLPISESISPSIPPVTENIIPEPIQISEPVQREEPSLRVYSRRPRVTQQN